MITVIYFVGNGPHRHLAIVGDGGGQIRRLSQLLQLTAIICHHAAVINPLKSDLLYGISATTRP